MQNGAAFLGAQYTWLNVCDYYTATERVTCQFICLWCFGKWNPSERKEEKAQTFNSVEFNETNQRLATQQNHEPDETMQHNRYGDPWLVLRYLK